MTFNISKFIKDWKNNLILLGVLGILTGLLVYLGINFITTLREHTKSFNEMIKAREEYNKFIVSEKDIPSNKLIKEYENHGNELKILYNEMFKILTGTKKVTTSVSGLEFKEELLKFQRDFKDKAQQKGITIPADLGFKEYMSDQIPAEKSIPLLTLQLDLISTFLDILLESGIEQVESIVKMNYAKDPVYKKRLPFTFIIKTDMKGLITFLDTLQAKPEILIVNSLTIDAIPLDKFRSDNNMGHLLEVSLEISFIDMNQNKS